MPRATSETGVDGPSSQRRRRAHLSCTTCRKRKLSCDRGQPCQRCLTSGTTESCTYETPASELDTLRAEVAQLKSRLARPDQQGASTSSLRRSPTGYYDHHTLLRYFAEIPALFPFIHELEQEWLAPAGLSLSKPRRSIPFVISLDELLPPRYDVDQMIEFYLVRLEPRLYRIVHVPAFRRAYGTFWDSRDPDTTALVLSMLSLAATAMPWVEYSRLRIDWITATETWLHSHGMKHRRVIHYQIWCLLYIAKRLNNVQKKRFWTDTGSLVQHAVVYGLHRTTIGDSVYSAEMKRRLWHTIRELDLASCFEFGLPSLLFGIGSESAIPHPTDDFDEDAPALATPSSPWFGETSANSFPLRLEIAQRLFASTVPLEHAEAMHYTHELARAMPSAADLASTFVRLQIQACMVAVMRVHVNDGEWMSHTLSYRITSDMLQEHIRFAHEPLLHLSETLTLGALALTRITMLQGSAVADSIKLLERSLPAVEERFVRCANSEPWTYVTLVAVIGLLRVHLGKDNRATAKHDSAQRYIDMYRRYIAQRANADLQSDPPPGDSADNELALPLNVDIEAMLQSWLGE